MTSLDTLALYERILWLVDPPVLHHTSNVILHEEYAAVAASLSDVAATFVKVGEVRDAVNQLEQNKACAERSGSLLEVMESLLQLQQELQHKITKVGSGLRVADEVDEKKEKKRKRNRKKDNKKKTASSGPSLNSSRSDDEYKVEKERQTEVKKQKRLEEKVIEIAGASDKNKSADVALVHEALGTLTKLKAINKRFQSGTKSLWVKSLNNLKLVLQHQSSYDAQTTDTLAAEGTARALEIVGMVFQRLTWTPEHAMEVRSLIATLSEACSSNDVLNSFFSQVRSQLKSLEMTIPISVAKSTRKVLLTDTESAKSLDSLLQAFQDLVTMIQTLPKNETVNHIIEALKVLQQLMAKDSTCSYHVHVQHSANDIRRWIGECPFTRDLGDKYKGFANDLATYSSKIYDNRKQNELQRLAMSLLRLVHEKTTQPSSNSQSTDAMLTRTRNAQDRLNGVLAQVELFQDGIFSLNQLEKAIKSFGDVMSYRSKSWNPLADINTRLCADKLICCIQMTKKPVHRAKYMKTLNKWKLKIDEHQ